MRRLPGCSLSCRVSARLFYFRGCEGRFWGVSGAAVRCASSGSEIPNSSAGGQPVRNPDRFKAEQYARTREGKGKAATLSTPETVAALAESKIWPPVDLGKRKFRSSGLFLLNSPMSRQKMFQSVLDKFKRLPGGEKSGFLRNSLDDFSKMCTFCCRDTFHYLSLPSTTLKIGVAHGDLRTPFGTLLGRVLLQGLIGS